MKIFTKPKKLLFKLSAILFLIAQLGLNAQSPCGPTVPSYTVNLTGSPGGIWTSPNVSRNGQCCGELAPNQCIYFYLTLDPNTAGIQIDMIGADPAGSLAYDISCTGDYPGGTIKCINGVGPHQITFCKPGGNSNIYKITSIPKPIFPNDDTVSLGCKHKLVSIGVVNSSVTWQSIFPGTPGQYNSYLDSVNVASPTYSPGAGAPPYVDYKVCGFPIASTCGYSLTVCDTVRIYNFPKLTASVAPNPASFCNLGPGSGVNLTVTATGGSPSYSYTWKNSASVTVGTGSNYYATAPGNYNVEIKDFLYDPVECPAIYTVVSVSQGTIPTVDAGASQKKCASNPLATLNGSVQFATGGIWTGGAGTYTPGNNFLNTTYYPSTGELAAGFVKLYLTTTGAGASCGNKTDSVIIYYASPLIATIPSASIACFNGTTTLNSNVSGGTPPYAYLWNTGSTNPSINAGQGNFSLIVNDSLGCTTNANYNLVSPTALNITFNVTNVTVNGGNDGTASVTISGGTPAYSVTWTPGSATTPSIGGLVYGVYTASVVDANGCKIAGSTVVNEPRCLGFTASSSATNVLCNGDGNGVASVTVTGGTPAYTYTWNTTPPQNTSTAVNLNAGVYSVIIEDANNCFQTANVVINEPTQLTNAMTHTNVTTLGGSNGAAAANSFGGSTPYAYLWNFGATTSYISGLTAGTYSVTITDDNGCSTTDNVTISQPPCNGLTLNLFKSNVSCYGGSNGSALAVVSGASGSYTINWSNGATGPSVSNLAAGNYSVMVTNGSNCTEYINFTIIQPSQLSIGLMPTNVSCNGNANGSIDLTIAGGTYPYSFNWNNGSSSEDLIYLAPGNYSVLVNDANGCTVLGAANITQPQPFNVTYTTQNVTCIYGNNGAIGLNVTGGVSPFTYTWSTGANTQSVSGLSAGGYSVVIKDANNCSLLQPLLIPLTQPDSVKVDSFIVACSVPGSGQTQITVVPQGGNPGAYQVSFNNGVSYQSAGAYSALLNNNATYTVVLKDNSNCLSLTGVILNIPAEVKADSINFNKCYPAGTLTVPVTVYPSGGVGVHSVSFNNGTSYLPAGIYSSNLNINNTYTVIVKDSRGCVSATSVITLPALMSATASITSNYNGQNISCFGLSNGAAFVYVTGGTGAYTYTWSTVPSQNSAAATNLSAGDYSVTVKDANNCSVTQTITLTQPAQLQVAIDSVSNYAGYNIRCNGASDGYVYITATGGVTAYNYLWSNGNNTANLSAVQAGNYTLTVVDQNNCTVITSTTLTQPPAISYSSSITQPLCYGSANGAIDITLSGGVNPFVYIWSNGAATEDISNITAGTYTVKYNDKNGCSDSVAITVLQPNALTLGKTISTIKCYGDTTGSINLTINGGTLPYSYIWSNGSPNKNIDSLSSGIYIIEVTDANGCKLKDTTTLSQPDSLQLSISSPIQFSGHNISYPNGNDGSVQLTVIGGVLPYSYVWSNLASDEDLYNVPAGVYNVTVVDLNGCRVSAGITLTEPLTLAMPTGFSPNSDGKNDMFVVHGIEAYPNNSLTIYNRWGNIVYKKDTYNNEWNGNSLNGQSLPDATYFAILEIDGGDKVLKGYVELRR